MMHEEMLEQIAEERGYDKGTSAGRSRAHDLLNEFIESLRHKRSVAETEGLTTAVRRFQAQIDAIVDAKEIVRRGAVINHE